MKLDKFKKVENEDFYETIETIVVFFTKVFPIIFIGIILFFTWLGLFVNYVEF